MKLTKEECKEALSTIKYFDDIRLKDLWAPDNNIKYELDLIDQLIDEHFRIKVLYEKINPPLKFKDLKADMWLWDNKAKAYIYLYKPLDWKPIKGLRYAERRINNSVEGYYMDFERERFYRTEVMSSDD